MLIHPDFMLETEEAQALYHSFAEPLPVIDFHCHLSPREIAEDRRFENLTRLWLAGDHYKWRALRAAGVDERFITGATSDWEKFEKWAENRSPDPSQPPLPLGPPRAHPRLRHRPPLLP